MILLQASCNLKGWIKASIGKRSVSCTAQPEGVHTAIPGPVTRYSSRLLKGSLREAHSPWHANQHPSSSASSGVWPEPALIQVQIIVLCSQHHLLKLLKGDAALAFMVSIPQCCVHSVRHLQQR